MTIALVGAGVLLGLGVWVLYRGRLYLPLVASHRSRRAELFLGALLASVGALLLGAGCRLVLAVWGAL